MSAQRGGPCPCAPRPARASFPGGPSFSTCFVHRPPGPQGGVPAGAQTLEGSFLTR